MTTEKNILRKNAIEKNAEMETINQEMKALDKLRSQLTSRADHLLNERTDLEAEVAALTLQIKHSSSQLETMNGRLKARNEEMYALEERCKTLETETAASARDSRSKQEYIVSLEEIMYKEKLKSDQLEKMLKETKEQLEDGRVSYHSLQSTTESLRFELKATVDKHKANLMQLTQKQDTLLSKLKQEHAAQIYTLDKTVTSLQRANSTLENEQAKLAREKQSSDQMCVALQKLFADKENEHQMQVKVLTERALDAEAQLDAGLSLQQELKRRVVELEEQVRELNDDKKERITKHQNAMEKMQDNLVKSSREKEALVDQISILQNQMETAQQNFIKERDKMMSEVEQRVHNAELKGEAMEVSRANEQLKAKEAVASYKKVVELHQTTVERMKSEAKDKRIELEKLINEERCVSQVGQRVQFESLFDWTQF